MILALGRLYSVNHRAGSDLLTLKDDPPGFEYFTYALALLPDIHEECSVLGVETLAYVGYFMQNMNRRDASFLYIGIALRMAINLGLHQEVPDNATLKAADREHRRRVWWSIYSLDRILSLKSGNPIAIADEDIGVRVPSQLPGEAEDSPVVVLRYYTELSRILGEITTLIYRRTSHTAQSLTTAVHSILLSLTRWEDSLPKALRLELDKGKLSRESISTFLHYYQCINMTVRPLLFHVVQKRLASIRAAGTAGVMEKSATGAQAYPRRPRPLSADASRQPATRCLSCPRLLSMAWWQHMGIWMASTPSLQRLCSRLSAGRSQTTRPTLTV